MQYKVIQSAMSNSYAVVPMAHGEKRVASNGQTVTYDPLPVCRCPVGYNVSDAQAKANAERICWLLNTNGIEWPIPSEAAAK